MRKQLVLVVDDDAPILRLVRAKLQADGYAVVTAMNGHEALDAFEREQPDLIILDMMMPVMDGLETLKHLRRDSAVPIVFLTARTSGADKVRSLDLGADDYVTKPFDPDELSARVAAILRRAGATSTPATDQVLRYGEWLMIDLTNRRVLANGAEMQLSRTEWDVLHVFASNVGRVMLHSELLSRVWGPEFRDETYYLRTWVSRLRRKLGDSPDGQALITTFPGIGYRLEAPHQTI
jgi:two-component system KDP operon response regulator KdpE